MSYIYAPNPQQTTQGSRAYHAMEGSKRKKAIDQSLDALRRKYGGPEPVADT